MLLPFCIFESSCVTVTMKVLLGIVIDFFHLCAKTWKIVADFAPGRAPTPRPRGLAWRGEMAAAGGLWSCEDPSRWAAVLECRGAVLRARAGPQGRLEALDRW